MPIFDSCEQQVVSGVHVNVGTQLRRVSVNTAREFGVLLSIPLQ